MFSSRLLIVVLLATFMTSGCTGSDTKVQAINPQAGTIAFERHKKLVIIEAAVNGKNGFFIIDNGFSESAVSPEFAEKAGINFTGRSSVRDAHNKKTYLRYGKVDSMQIEGFRFSNAKVYRVDTSVFFPCRKVDGIIGASVINKANWMFDFQAGRLQISLRPFTGGGFRIPVGFSSNNSTFTDLTIRGVTARTKIDLGYSGTLKIRNSDFGRYFTGDSVTAIEGSMSLSVSGLGKKLTYGKLKQPEPVSFFGDELPGRSSITLISSLKEEAYLGVDFFDDYRLIINSANKEYLLENYRPDTTGELKEYAADIYLQDGTWLVTQKITTNNNTEALNIGAKVLEINDVPAESLGDICTYNELFEEWKSSGRPLKLKVEQADSVFVFPLRVQPSGVLRK